ncbi:hypothetical protein SAY87_004974 [Trapa incisa]|uniref:Cyclin N-terminal domain-containing protein n=1 Tax=Trapa incisa TaxID=236973 RepID=A0AAN7JQJ6_9MYRT|nr:hypothetical protein SAY87_004974 [Trapa incisa]
MMAGSDENNPGVIGLANLQGGLQAGGAKVVSGIGHNRRALSSINRNIIVAAPYPCAFNKKLLPGKNVLCDKNQPAVMHRPITRQFAAQMANKQQNKPEDTKRLFQIERDPPADGSNIDVDDYKMGAEFSAPMFVQHTEAMLEEIDLMDEVEMEDVDEFLPVDIDSGDKNNSLAVVEYIDDLYSYYKKAEGMSCVPPNYMEHQFDINERMRGILIDWLIEVHYKFELMDETLYLMVNLIDRFLAVQPIVRKKLQLVGVTAMLLACKYEEVSVPVVEDLILISDKAYTRKEVLDMERLVVNTLQFNMSVPTPYVFMRRFLKAAYSDKKLELLSFFLIELCLVEYATLRFPPSLLAAAAVYTAQCTISKIRGWSRTCEFHSTYAEEQLLECSRMMVTLHQKAGTGKLTGVHRKYSTSKYGYAAKAEPANFLLEGCCCL